MFKKIIVVILTIFLLAGCSPQGDTPEPAPTPEEPVAAAPEAPTEVTVYQGLGKSVLFRSGPGSDSQEVPVYSLNYVTADATFDAEGKIINVFVDALEVSTPNYDGASMPHFSGWPETEGYNITDHDTGEVVSVSENTVENIAAEVNGWVTKRERGDNYGMNPKNEWHKQMDYFQDFFVGMTMDEVEEWFVKYASDINGRPLNPATATDDNKVKVDALSDEEKAMLAEVVTGATMSLNDGHGNILAAIRNAYDNRVEVVIPIAQ